MPSLQKSNFQLQSHPYIRNIHPLTHGVAERDGGIIGGDIETGHMHALRSGIRHLRAVGQPRRFDDLELSVLREDEEIGGGKKREATEELWSDVYLDGRGAAHEAQVVEFDEAFAEHVAGIWPTSGESDGG